MYARAKKFWKSKGGVAEVEVGWGLHFPSEIVVNAFLHYHRSGYKDYPDPQFWLRGFAVGDGIPFAWQKDINTMYDVFHYNKLNIS